MPSPSRAPEERALEACLEGTLKRAATRPPGAGSGAPTAVLRTDALRWVEVPQQGSGQVGFAMGAAP